jgi:hypothetical protein
MVFCFLGWIRNGEIKIARDWRRNLRIRQCFFLEFALHDVAVVISNVWRNLAIRRYTDPRCSCVPVDRLAWPIDDKSEVHADT